MGGLKFYERAEIKDLIAYFRVITNANDNFSIKRIINKPKRGIGKMTIDKLELESHDKSRSMFSIIKEYSVEDLTAIVGKKNSRTLKVFMASVEDLQEVLENTKMRFIDLFEETFDFKSTYAKVIDADDRLANIDEFYGYLRDFFMNHIDLNLEDFLNEISLESAADSIRWLERQFLIL